MPVALSPFPTFLDALGNPRSGGKLYTYQAGTTIPLPTFTDRGGTVANSNPVILDSAGRARVWLTENVPYFLSIENADGTDVRTVDNFYAGADPSQLTAAGIVPATGGTYTGAVSFAGGATFDGTEAQDAATLNSLGISGVRNANLWINPDFAINQAGATTAADAAYGFDQSIVLAQTGSVGLSLLSQPADGIPFALRMTQPDATAKRIGNLQIVEAANCLAYRGKSLVLQAKVRASVGVTVRAALVAWSGAVDAPTRDVVNTWTSTDYSAGNFFIAGVTPIVVGAAAVNAGVWSDIVVSSASAGGSVAPSNLQNLYMLFWTDSTLAQNATLDISLVGCGLGTAKQIWTPPDRSQETSRCSRYFQPFSYQGGGTGAVNSFVFSVATGVQMRAVPVVTNAAGGAGSGYASVYNGSVWSQSLVAANTVSALAAGPASVVCSYPFAGAVTGWPCAIGVSGTLAAQL